MWLFSAEPRTLLRAGRLMGKFQKEVIWQDHEDTDMAKLSENNNRKIKTRKEGQGILRT